jgi:hypothetical protein
MSKFPIRLATQDIEAEINKLSVKDREKYISSDSGLKIIDYDTANEKDLLNPTKLNEDIFNASKKSFEYLIIKCQRLYLIKRHKFYQELGYQNLEEYADKEHGISRFQLFKYISIYEKLEKELIFLFNNQYSSKQLINLSLEKLYLISKLEESEKISEWFKKIIETKISVNELEKSLDFKNETKPGKVNFKKEFKKFKNIFTSETAELEKNEIQELINFLQTVLETKT